MLCRLFLCLIRPFVHQFLFSAFTGARHAHFLSNRPLSEAQTVFHILFYPTSTHVSKRDDFTAHSGFGTRPGVKRINHRQKPMFFFPPAAGF